MDPINSEALTRLKLVIEGLLPSDTADSTAEIWLLTAHVNPIGLSGIIGLNDDPYGDIIGRHVQANVAISVKSNNSDNLSSHFENTLNALMGLGQNELRQQGILKFSMDKPGAPEQSGNTRLRDINIQVLFEYWKYPEGGEGVIESIPINVT